MKPREIIMKTCLVVVLIITAVSMLWPAFLWSFVIVGPLVIVAIVDIRQKKHSIRKNFPIIGHLRYLLESFRPEIQQYFVETDTEGTPINRQLRSLVYSRAKNEIDTTPFGTKLDVYKPGYECMTHSLYPKRIEDIDENPRILFGGSECKQPYHCSILNISAMSFGALSKNAILALSKGAQLGGFAHNTGEGGISHYHLDGGGDLIWQIGTGYFGCRNESGGFNEEKFSANANLTNVKMIEIKLSQGSKPGHGGILPASKNTEEIAEIRGVEAFTDVLSPPYHTAFSDAEGLMHFIKKLRELSNGKPIGFKLCIGNKVEFLDLCKAMLSTGIKPDFITVDGGEGGTGASPVEFSNSMGMPLREGLAFVYNTLIEYKLKDEIKISASGKILSAFHIIRLMALGADTVNSARAMMLALGCIQALRCHTNNCPVGVATQNESLMKGLDVNNKYVRVANYHRSTIFAFVEMLAAAGLTHSTEIRREHILHRKGPNQMVPLTDIYPYPVGF